MFPQELIDKTDAKFAGLLECAGKSKKDELLSAMSNVSGDVLFATKWIYANSPLSDWANYKFDMFKACAEHSLFLLENSPFLKNIDLNIFLNYVLHLRVNEEELCDCRKFFYDQLAHRVNHLSAYDAVIEANYWNAENMEYQAADRRTKSAITAFRSTYGRCGEESTFGVNVFRAIGIPARQIYTPRWAHCDDNHAWVEVYCNGSWHFLGACEPEEVLNRGWFTNASSRAMLIHSRCFGECKNEDVISKVGMASFLNNLELYAVTKRITVAVKDTKGQPVSGAQVSFGILNYSSIFNAAIVTTDEKGLASLNCGLGSINVHVKKGDIYTERMIFVPDSDIVEIALEKDQIATDVWEDFVNIAPRDQIVNGAKPTEEQKAIGMKKTAAANEKRIKRFTAMYNSAKAEELAKKYGYSENIYDLLKAGCENFDAIAEFLEDTNYDPADKEALLLTLTKKDMQDINIDILKESLDLTKDYKRDSLFFPYVACPRVFFEPLSENRRFILNYFSEEEKNSFKADPRNVWSYIKENIGFDSALEYGQIVTQPIGALTVKNANPLSRKILFVSICRALGIPAKVNHMDEQAEYYLDDKFVPVETLKAADAKIIFEKENDETWQYGGDFGLAMLVNGEYQALNLSKEQWNGNRLEINANSGSYRVITDNRLPNGDIHGSKYHFNLDSGQTYCVKLHKYPAALSEMLDNFALEDFKVSTKDGQPVSAEDITKDRKAVLMWLEEGKEPTEHILNEMLEQEDDFKRFPVVFMVRSAAALENAKIRKVLDTFKQIEVYYDSFVPNVEILARRMYVDPEKLPLVIVTTGRLNAVYACSGYNVGSANMIIRVLDSQN
ncbi:transglutaminase [Tyzzerella sp. OttesenSCG-928-J15]|nr:transglutaminase [Tyzzerella sp. OttesenSCG-928-J15]